MDLNFDVEQKQIYDISIYRLRDMLHFVYDYSQEVFLRLYSVK